MTESTPTASPPTSIVGDGMPFEDLARFVASHANRSIRDRRYRHELGTFLMALPRELLIKLEVLMNFGRGDRGNPIVLCRDTYSRAGCPWNRCSRIVEEARLGEYLDRGLSLMLQSPRYNVEAPSFARFSTRAAPRHHSPQTYVVPELDLPPVVVPSVA